MNIKKLKEKVLSEIRIPELYRKDVLRYVEERIDGAFGLACSKNLSINEWQPDSRFVGQLNQKTALITARLFDLWESAVVEVLNTHLSKKFKGIEVKSVNDPIGDLTILFPDNSETRWEIKSSQAENSFTGATHSASKCNNYIFINYDIEGDLKLKQGEPNIGFIKEWAVFVWDNMEAKWAGKPSEHSSFTSLKVSSLMATKRPEIVVIGSLKQNRVWCKIEREKAH